MSMTDMFPNKLRETIKTNFTSDFSSIQEALDDLPSTGGEVCVVGTYQESIRIKKPNVRLYGRSWKDTIKTPDNATQLDNDATIRIFQPNCIVENLQIDGNREGNAALNDFDLGRWADGVAVYADNCVIRNNYIHDTIGHGVIVWNESFEGETAAGKRKSIRIEGNHITGEGQRAGIDIASTETNSISLEIVSHDCSIVNNFLDGRTIIIHTGNDILIGGNIVTNTLTTGISVHTGSKRCLVVGNNVSNCVSGISGQEVFDYTVVGNKVYNCTNGRGINLNTVDHGLVSDNSVILSSQESIYITGGSHLSIKSNKLKDGYHGVYQTTIMEHLDISSNFISGMTNEGITVREAKYVVVQENKVSGVRTGISTPSSGTMESLSVKNNYISGTSLNGISIHAIKSEVIDNTLKDITYDGIEIGFGSNGADVKTKVLRNILDIVGNRGIYVKPSTDNVEVRNNELSNVTGNVINPQANTIVRENIGYKTENNGTALFTTGVTIYAVTHGLDRNPLLEDIQLTPASYQFGMGNFWIGNISSTTFEIRCSTAPTNDVNFAWSVRKV